MNLISRWEWYGNPLILVLLCITGILLPIGVVYFMTNLMKIEEEIADPEKLAEFIRQRKR